MPIYTRENPLLLAGEDIQTESTAGEVFQESLYSIQEGLIGSLSRSSELSLAEGETQELFGRAAASREAPGQQMRQLSRRLTVQEAQSRIRDYGLEGELPVTNEIREDTLRILIERKQEELRRRTILSQASGGSAVLAQLSGSLIGSLGDPTNVALAFVPVVGQARYAAWLKNAGGVFGRTGLRLGVGGVEGLVGLAPVEALNYMAHQQQYSDYTAYDSLLTVAGGAFFGSALHGGAGLFGEAVVGFRPKPPPSLDVRNMAGRTVGEVTPAGSGSRQPPPVLTREQAERLTIMDRLAEGRPIVTPAVRSGAEAGSIIDGRLAALSQAAQDGRLAPDEVKALVAEDAELETLLRAQRRAEAEGIVLSPENRLTPEELAMADNRRQEIRLALEKNKTAQSAEKQLTELQKKLDRIDNDNDLVALAARLAGEDVDNFRAGLSPAARAAIDNDPFAALRPGISIAQPETQAAALRTAIAQAVEGRRIDVTPNFLTDPAFYDPEGAFAAMQRNLDTVDGASLEASRWADSVKPVDDDVATLREMTALDEAETRAMLENAGLELPSSVAEALAKDAQMAQAQGRAAQAAALCMQRTGG